MLELFKAVVERLNARHGRVLDPIFFCELSQPLKLHGPVGLLRDLPKGQTGSRS